MNHYTSLPFEIVSLIADHLGPEDYYTCALINKLFYAVVNPLLWRTIKIKDRPKALQFLDSVIEAKNPVGTHVKHLTLFHIKWRNSLFLRMAKHLGELKELCIPDGQGLTDISLQQLPEYCPKITFFSLSKYNITQQSMDMLIQQYPQLHVLELLSCTSQALESVSGPAPCRLKKLTINTVRSPRADDTMDENTDSEDDEDAMAEMLDPDDEDDAMVGNTVVNLACFPLLTHLDIFGSTFSIAKLSLFTPPPSPATAMNASIVHCPLLESLYLFGNFELEPDQLVYFVKSHPKLKTLCLDQGPCTDTVLYAISTYCPSIMELYIYENPSISHHGVRRLIQNCPALRCLDLTHCDIQAHKFPELRYRYSDMYGNLRILDSWAIDRIRFNAQHDHGDVNRGEG